MKQQALPYTHPLPNQKKTNNGRYSLFLFAMMSDMQFSFKPQHSTLVCGLFYKGTIRHYLQHCNNVYSCLLDASNCI